ncbi:hypothetical protein GCM10027429_14040 [Marivirga atlantica]
MSKYKDIINLDSDYEVTKSNLDELKGENLSKFWINNPSERRLGFIGKNYLRLHIKFLSIIKNPKDSLEYLVYGKSMVNENICDFQGVIKVMESYYFISEDFPYNRYGILAGQYEFYENSGSSSAGIFRGRFTTNWYKNEEGSLTYNDRWSVSAMYNNNQFAGDWTKYGSSNKLTANWGDSRIPLSGDLDVGSSEFRPADKYSSNGWLIFLIANGASPDKMNIEGARKTENLEWWK